MTIFIASAFSKNNMGGNTAGVCLHGEALDKGQKMAISKKLGFAETAYISTGKNGFMVEYFTPAEEVPLCGHATIASFIVMQNKLPLNKSEYIIETKCGNLHVILDDEMVFMEQKKPIFYETLSKIDLARCFDMDVINDKFPIEIGSTGLRDIILPVKDLTILERMKPSFGEISAISRKFNTVGIHAFTLDGERIVCRNFAPLYDVPEESATGTSNCVLASYLWKNNILRKNEYIFEQGYTLNSPSEIIVRLTTNHDNIDKVVVGGKGYLMDEKTINIDEL
ncbi:MAG: PhzF family phenazine biosynthesis protein [Defluviitaleaceae bacterium]|nr:PhzF family phenazine biosynthesis protein [Defluviitaleaceae bacterium]